MEKAMGEWIEIAGTIILVTILFLIPAIAGMLALWFVCRVWEKYNPFARRL